MQLSIDLQLIPLKIMYTKKCTIDLCRCSSIGLYSVNSVLFLYSFFIDCFFFGFYRLLHELIMTCDKYGLGKSNKIFINYKCTYNLFICVPISYSFQMEIDNKKKSFFKYVIRLCFVSLNDAFLCEITNFTIWINIFRWK